MRKNHCGNFPLEKKRKKVEIGKQKTCVKIMMITKNEKVPKKGKEIEK